MVESQVEDIFGHDVDDDALVITDLVFEVNNTLIFIVGFKHLSEFSDLFLELLLVTKLFIMVVAEFLLRFVLGTYKCCRFHLHIKRGVRSTMTEKEVLNFLTNAFDLLR